MNINIIGRNNPYILKVIAQDVNKEIILNFSNSNYLKTQEKNIAIC